MRVGVLGEPPREEGQRLVDRPAEQVEPWLSEPRVEGLLLGCPLRMGVALMCDAGRWVAWRENTWT